MVGHTYWYHLAPNHDYLKDAHGNQVTPIALTSGRPDPLPLYAGRGPTRAYHKAHGNITPEEKARAERESLRYHAKRAAEARSGGMAVNRTAEWRSSRENTPSQEEEVFDSEDEDVMQP
jgi:hypothetical protein